MPSDAAVATAGKAAQMAVRKSALKDNLTAWSLLDPFRPFATASNWSIIVMEIIRDFRAVSGQQAMETYNRLRPLPEIWHEPTPAMDDVRVLRSLLVTGPGRIQQLVSGGLEPPAAHAQAFKLNSRAVSSAVLDGGRETTEAAIHNDQTALGFARVPSPGACAFCIMLASRGAVYSKETVLTTTAKSRRGAGKSFHEGCACTLLPVFDREQGLPDIVEQAEQIYTKASADASGIKDILRAIRKSEGVR